MKHRLYIHKSGFAELQRWSNISGKWITMHSEPYDNQAMDRWISNNIPMASIKNVYEQ